MMAFPPVLPDVVVAVRDPAAVAITTCGSTPATTRSPHGAIGRRVDVRVDLDEVIVTCDGDEVARHRRSLGEAPHDLPIRRPRRVPASACAPIAGGHADDRRRRRGPRPGRL